MISRLKRKTYSIKLELRCKITGNDTMSICNAKNVSVLSNVMGDIIMITVIAIGRCGITSCFVSTMQFVTSIAQLVCFNITSCSDEYLWVTHIWNMFFATVFGTQLEFI